MKEKLLINFVYYQNVGHAVEAARFSLGYHKANPGLEISVVLNKHTTIEVLELCPWVESIYTVDIPDDNIEILSEHYDHIPKEWDYVVSTDRSIQKEYCPGAYWEYYRHMDDYLIAKKGKGICGDETLSYTPNQDLRLEIPKSKKQYADEKVVDTKVKVGIMFGGHKDSKYFPSMESWQLILHALNERYDDISFYFFGKLKRKNKETVSPTSQNEINQLLDNYENTINCFDIGFLNQLAVAEKLDVFISPHTGFAFAILAVGTPWLTISGGPWAEYFYNGVPFYSVLPDIEKYPIYKDGYDEPTTQDNGERVLSMSKARIKEDLLEIVKAADILINNRWTYEECLQNHFDKMLDLNDGDPSRIHSFDYIHWRYVNRV